MKLIKYIIILITIFLVFITIYSTKLPPYDPNQAIANGDVVSVHGKVTNLTKLEDFINKASKGEKDKITLTNYTIEGDAIIGRLSFDGKFFEYNLDTRRDAFAGSDNKKIKKYKFTKIDKEVNNDFIEYFLSRDGEPNRINILQLRNTD